MRKPKIINNTEADHSSLIELANHFFPFAQKQMGFSEPVTIVLISDEENGADHLGKTGYYNPSDSNIGLYTDNRHPKDILRSLAHELVHHTQNGKGMFNLDIDLGPGYAQNDEHMREMERQAYELGNMCFRDWEDGNKEEIRKWDLKESIRQELRKRMSGTPEILEEGPRWDRLKGAMGSAGKGAWGGLKAAPGAFARGIKHSWTGDPVAMSAKPARGPKGEYIPRGAPGKEKKEFFTEEEQTEMAFPTPYQQKITEKSDAEAWAKWIMDFQEPALIKKAFYTVIYDEIVNAKGEKIKFKMNKKLEIAQHYTAMFYGPGGPGHEEAPPAESPVETAADAADAETGDADAGESPATAEVEETGIHLPSVDDEAARDPVAAGFGDSEEDPYAGGFGLPDSWSTWQESKETNNMNKKLSIREELRLRSLIAEATQRVMQKQRLLREDEEEFGTSDVTVDEPSAHGGLEDRGEWTNPVPDVTHENTRDDAAADLQFDTSTAFGTSYTRGAGGAPVGNWLTNPAMRHPTASWTGRQEKIARTLAGETVTNRDGSVFEIGRGDQRFVDRLQSGDLMGTDLSRIRRGERINPNAWREALLEAGDVGRALYEQHDAEGWINEDEIKDFWQPAYEREWLSQYRANNDYHRERFARQEGFESWNSLQAAGGADLFTVTAEDIDAEMPTRLEWAQHHLGLGDIKSASGAGGLAGDPRFDMRVNPNLTQQQAERNMRMWGYEPEYVDLPDGRRIPMALTREQADEQIAENEWGVTTFLRRNVADPIVQDIAQQGQFAHDAILRPMFGNVQSGEFLAPWESSPEVYGGRQFGASMPGTYRDPRMQSVYAEYYGPEDAPSEDMIGKMKPMDEWNIPNRGAVIMNSLNMPESWKYAAIYYGGGAAMRGLGALRGIPAAAGGAGASGGGAAGGWLGQGARWLGQVPGRTPGLWRAPGAGAVESGLVNLGSRLGPWGTTLGRWGGYGAGAGAAGSLGMGALGVGGHFGRSLIDDGPGITDLFGIKKGASWLGDQLDPGRSGWGREGWTSDANFGQPQPKYERDESGEFVRDERGRRVIARDENGLPQYETNEDGSLVYAHDQYRSLLSQPVGNLAGLGDTEYQPWESPYEARWAREADLGGMAAAFNAEDIQQAEMATSLRAADAQVQSLETQLLGMAMENVANAPADLVNPDSAMAFASSMGVDNAEAVADQAQEYVERIERLKQNYGLTNASEADVGRVSEEQMAILQQNPQSLAEFESGMSELSTRWNQDVTALLGPQAGREAGGQYAFDFGVTGTGGNQYRTPNMSPAAIEDLLMNISSNRVSNGDYTIPSGIPLPTLEVTNENGETVEVTAHSDPHRWWNALHQMQQERFNSNLDQAIAGDLDEIIGERSAAGSLARFITGQDGFLMTQGAEAPVEAGLEQGERVGRREMLETYYNTRVEEHIAQITENRVQQMVQYGNMTEDDARLQLRGMRDEIVREATGYAIDDVTLKRILTPIPPSNQDGTWNPLAGIGQFGLGSDNPDSAGPEAEAFNADMTVIAMLSMPSHRDAILSHEDGLGKIAQLAWDYGFAKNNPQFIEQILPGPQYAQLRRTISMAAYRKSQALLAWDTAGEATNPRTGERLGNIDVLSEESQQAFSRLRNINWGHFGLVEGSDGSANLGAWRDYAGNGHDLDRLGPVGNATATNPDGELTVNAQEMVALNEEFNDLSDLDRRTPLYSAAYNALPEETQDRIYQYNVTRSDIIGRQYKRRGELLQDEGHAIPRARQMAGAYYIASSGDPVLDQLRGVGFPSAAIANQVALRLVGGQPLQDIQLAINPDGRAAAAIEAGRGDLNGPIWVAGETLDEARQSGQTLLWAPNLENSAGMGGALPQGATVRFGSNQTGGETTQAIEVPPAPGAGASAEEQAEYRRQLQQAAQQQVGAQGAPRPRGRVVVPAR